MSHKIQQAFLTDVQHHQMTVLRDDGLYRHLRFGRPGSSDMHFAVVTYPGGLLYTGDMGTFAFERRPDMFEFFRTTGGGINPTYWSSKLTAADSSGRQTVKEFSEETFERAIKLEVLDWVRQNKFRTTKEQRRELWDEVIYLVIGADGDEGGYRKQIAAHDFAHTVKTGLSFSFDLMDEDFTKHTHRFLWCCYALVWGIQQYDKFKAQEEQKEAIA